VTENQGALTENQRAKGRERKSKIKRQRAKGQNFIFFIREDSKHRRCYSTSLNFSGLSRTFRDFSRFDTDKSIW
jgi:hypothetical protein